MNLKCMLGFHNWRNDCESCSICGETRENQHNWMIDCEKCSKCGTIRKNYHRHENGVFRVCGQGIVTDARDGTIYKIIKIGNQILFAENLRYKIASGNCFAYEGKEENVKKFGYLYD